MLRRRPRRTAPTWLRHPSTGWLVLAVVYLTATVINLLLAMTMHVLWPFLMAALLALVTALCTRAAATARRRR
jgi:hypothetical protein